MSAITTCLAEDPFITGEDLAPNPFEDNPFDEVPSDFSEILFSPSIDSDDPFEDKLPLNGRVTKLSEDPESDASDSEYFDCEEMENKVDISTFF